MKKIFTFVLIMMSLVYFSNISFAQAQGAGAAGAAGGTATAAGITTGTIVAGAVIAAAAAAAIAASGGGGGTDEIVPTKSAEKQAEENLVNNSSKTTQASTSQVSLALNSAELANLSSSFTAAAASAGYGGQTAASALSGLTVKDLQDTLATVTPAGGALTPLAVNAKLQAFLNGMKNANPNAYNAFLKMLQGVAARPNTVDGQNAINALSALFTAIAADPNGAAALSAVQTVLTDAANNYQAMMGTLLAALHPGYTVYFVTVHHGSQVFTTTSHLKK